MKRFTLACLSVAALCPLSSTHAAQVLQSVSLVPQEGTQWTNSTVRLNFGDLGMATVTIAPIGGGSFFYVEAPAVYNNLNFSLYNGPTPLSNGDIFNPSTEVIFNVLPGSSPLSGFSITVALDSGIFPEGSVFSPRSLGHSNTNQQYFGLVSGLEIPDPTQLPSDGLNSADLQLLDAGNSLYGPSTNGANSKGLAFGIDGGSFTANFLTTPGYQPGGVAFALVTPVPEPSVSLLGVAALGLALRRRRA